MSRSKELFIVGIASSAGGIPALMALLKNAYCHRSMCFILTPHLSRDYETQLPEMLAKASGLEAKTITEGMPIEHCKLFILPMDSYAELRGEHLFLLPRPSWGANNASDVMFTSLAKAYGRNSIGVVLSGSAVGADGSKGIVAIRRAGGHTYAQDPETAEFADMPKLAIETGCVQSVLSPEEIGDELSLITWALS